MSLVDLAGSERAQKTGLYEEIHTPRRANPAAVTPSSRSAFDRADSVPVLRDLTPESPSAVDAAAAPVVAAPTLAKGSPLVKECMPAAAAFLLV